LMSCPLKMREVPCAVFMRQAGYDGLGPAKRKEFGARVSDQ